MFGRISFVNAISGHNTNKELTDGSILKNQPFFPIRSKRVIIGNTLEDNIRILNTSKEEFQIEIIVSNNESVVNTNEFFIRSIKGKPFQLNGVPVIGFRKIELKNNDRLTIGQIILIFNKCFSNKSVTETIALQSVPETQEVSAESKPEVKTQNLSQNVVKKSLDSQPIVDCSALLSMESPPKQRHRKLSQTKSNSKTKLGNENEIQVIIDLNSDTIVDKEEEEPNNSITRAKRKTQTENKSEERPPKTRKTRAQISSVSNEDKSSENLEKTKPSLRKRGTTTAEVETIKPKTAKTSKKVEFDVKLESFEPKSGPIEPKTRSKSTKKAKKDEKSTQQSNECSLKTSKSKTKAKTQSDIKSKRKTVEVIEDIEKPSKTRSKPNSKTNAKSKVSPTPQSVTTTKSKAKESKTKSNEQKCAKNAIKAEEKTKSRPKREAKPPEDTNKRSLRSRTTQKK